METATFQIGKTYEMRSLGDQNCIWRFTVIGRTTKTVRIVEHDAPAQAKTFRVSIYDGSEMVRPFGRYSMNPVLRAERIVA